MNGQRKLVLASDNAHKLEEFRRFFREAGIPLNVLSMREAGFIGEIEETETTFAGNARLKAHAVSDATGLFCLADDSGLEVDALGGAPGVYSARYAGTHGDDEANIRKLLEELRDVPDEKRTARFVCALCAVREDGEELSVCGTANGLILREKRGDGRFGYDPIFFDKTLGKTFAELDGSVKNEISHRGNALKQLLQKRDFFLK